MVDRVNHTETLKPSRCEDDLNRAARKLESCSDRVEHLEALVDFYQSDNEHLRSILRMKDALRQSKEAAAETRRKSP